MTQAQRPPRLPAFLTAKEVAGILRLVMARFLERRGSDGNGALLLDRSCGPSCQRESPVDVTSWDAAVLIGTKSAGNVFFDL